MKKTTFFLAILALLTVSLNAQENSLKNDYNKWSIDFGIGASHATAPLSRDYYSGDFDDMAYNLSVRHMFNERFGLRFGGIYSKIDNSARSLPFSTGMITFTGEGVINLGSLLNFHEFTNRFNLLAHTGVQFSSFNFDETPVNPVPDNDNTYGFMFGITPQFKISERIAFNLDFTMIGNLNQDRGIEGFGVDPATDYVPVERNFDGIVATVTAGLSIYLGDNEKHADWVRNSTEEMIERDNENIIEDKINSKFQDSDNDGVLDFLDREPNTPSGVAVNTKGEAILDSDDDGIIDNLDECPNQAAPLANKGCPYPDTDGDGVLDKDDMCPNVMGTPANNGCPAVTVEVQKELNNYAKIVNFKTGKATITKESEEALGAIISILEEYPNTKFSIDGHTDSVGDEEYNMKLSKARALSVKSYLVEQGIDEFRLSSEGYGETRPIASNKTKAGRAENRRVEINLKK